MKKNNLIVLKQIDKYKIWGINQKIGEKILLICNKDESNYINNSSNKIYKLFSDLKLRKLFFGKKYNKYTKFPFIIKFIYSAENLSIQVHKKNDDELWYFIKKGEALIGTNSKNINSININNINKYKIDCGTFVNVSGGVIHSILAKNEICEINNNYNDTFRLYDWNRKRRIDYKSAMTNIDINKNNDILQFKKNKSVFHDFKIYEKNDKKLFVALKSCKICVIVDGTCNIYNNNKKYSFLKENIFIIPPHSFFRASGSFKCLIIK